MKSPNLPINKFRNYILLFGLLGFILYYITQASGLTYIYLSSFFALVALILVFVSIYSLVHSLGKSPQTSGYCFILTGIGLSVVGQLLWTIFSLIYPSKLVYIVPTVFFFATYILNFIGYLKVTLVTKILVNEFLAMIVSFLLLGIILTTLIYFSSPFSPNFVQLGFVGGDAIRSIIIALLLQKAIIYQGGLFGRYWLSIFIGNIFITIGNFASGAFSQGYISFIWPFTLIDLIFIGGYLYVAHGFYGLSDTIKIAQNKIISHKKITH